MKFLNSKTVFIFLRIFVFVIIAVFWGIFGSPLIAVVFILLLSIPSIIRYKIINSPLLFLGEFIISVVFSFFWVPSLTGLFLIILGISENIITAEMDKIINEMNMNRELMISIENELINELKQTETAKMKAEISERNRIAQDLHDHIGHEIAGISLGLQATKKMLQNGENVSAENMLDNVIHRTNETAIHLRETVHNLKPVAVNDCSRFEDICKKFTHCPVRFSGCEKLYGITEDSHDLLVALLKEALTNVTRHSCASIVDVKVSANSHHVRMIIADNGKVSEDFVMGMGLSGMKERIAAVNGIFSIDITSGFKIICVLKNQ